jgi:phospho-N-acetylmuramoyl-pentapeptide-transferase
MVLNRPPAKVFMGDVGSMAIGGLLGMAVADMTVNAAPRATIPWLAIAGLVVVAVVMLVELVPPPLQILSVKLRKKRLFPMTPIHHAFQKAGWPEIKIVAMFFALQVVGSGIGYLMVSKAVR